MKIIPVSKARANIREIIEAVASDDKVFVLGRHKHPEAVLIKFPEAYNPETSEITNINSYSSSFDFLKKEPELYSHKDILKNV